MVTFLPLPNALLPAHASDMRLTFTFGVQWSIFFFLADVGFTVGKLIPATYNCRSLDCAKIVHNCCMTLCAFLFMVSEGCMLRVMAKKANTRKRDVPIVKFLEILVSLVYVLYDATTKDPPGSATTVLVLVTCFAEVILICQECHTIWKYGG